MHDRKRDRLFRFFLPFLLSGLVLLVQSGVLFAVSATLVFLHQLRVIDLYKTPQLFGLLLPIASFVIGSFFAIFMLRRPLRPIKDLMDAADRIAAGDYTVRLRPSGNREFRALGEKFNHMAEELGSVEMLRNDFTRNFSHEFKTPIVSIRGFARMLQRSDLSPAERDEYLGIIIEESERLSSLSENVLTLGKLEQQSSLTDIHAFNLSEQIRRCAAMLSAKWEERGIEFALDGEECSVSASEDLLKQVWINLIDNAIKFSPENSCVSIQTKKTEKSVLISVHNPGPMIPPEQCARLFDKFYQGDRSHSTAGNGLGLAIVKRIMTLHGGTVSVASNETGNTFTVSLPTGITAPDHPSLP